MKIIGYPDTKNKLSGGPTPLASTSCFSPPCEIDMWGHKTKEEADAKKKALKEKVNKTKLSKKDSTLTKKKKKK